MDKIKIQPNAGSYKHSGGAIMKNQKKKKPKGQLKGTWDLQYKSPQKSKHTADINTTKTAHRKSITRGNR